jgi:hypothetical protein
LRVASKKTQLVKNLAGSLYLQRVQVLDRPSSQPDLGQGKLQSSPLPIGTQRDTATMPQVGFCLPKGCHNLGRVRQDVVLGFLGVDRQEKRSGPSMTGNDNRRPAFVQTSQYLGRPVLQLTDTDRHVATIIATIPYICAEARQICRSRAVASSFRGE